MFKFIIEFLFSWFITKKQSVFLMPLVRPCGIKKYKLESHLVFADLTVPAGFESDGASIPRMFWSLVGHPFTPSILPCAFGHDYLYAKAAKMQEKKARRRAYADADKWLYVNLRHSNAKIVAVLFFIAVRAYSLICRR